MSGRTSVLTVAAVFLFLALLSPFVFPGLFGDGFGGIIAVFVFTPFFFIVGIIVLIVGLASGGRARQQQQQQVVVVGAAALPVGPAMEARLRCPQCQHLNPVKARFCTQCGTHFGSGAR